MNVSKCGDAENPPGNSLEPGCVVDVLILTLWVKQAQGRMWKLLTLLQAHRVGRPSFLASLLASGNFTSNTDPSPGWLSTVTLPPCACATH